VRDFVPVDGNAARGGYIETAEEIEQSGLAGAAGAMKATKSPLSTSRLRPWRTWIFSPPRL